MPRRKRKTFTTALPSLVYVKWERDGDEPYLALYETPEGPDDGDLVGIYELRDTKTKRVVHALED
jgi:hypothetical protein